MNEETEYLEAKLDIFATSRDLDIKMDQAGRLLIRTSHGDFIIILKKLE